MVKRVGGLPTCVRSATVAWWKNFNNVIDEGEGESIIYTDGIDDYISAVGWPYSSPNSSVASPMLFNFKAIFNPAMVTGIHPIISIPKYITDFCMYLDDGDLYVRSRDSGGSSYTYVQDIYTYPVDKYGVEVDVTIAMSHGTSDPLVVSIDSTPLVSTGTPTAMGSSGRPYIGYVPTGVIDGSEHYATGLSIWNIYEYIGYDGLGGTYAYISGIPGGTESSWQITDGTGIIVYPFTLYGNPSTISAGGTYRVQESIGVRTDTVYYGQYLQGGVTGVLDFDGVNDYIQLDSAPDVTGTKTISFSLYVPTAVVSTGVFILIDDGGNDIFYGDVVDNGDTIRIVTATSGSIANGGVSIDISDRRGMFLDVIVVKGTRVLTTVTVNGVSETGFYTTGYGGASGYTIGSSTSFLYGLYIWDININDEHAYAGRPSGDQDSAWADTIGSIDGTVNGSPSTEDLDSIINFYRTSGTFDYTDPSDGSSVTGVSIPGDGLYTIPADGICEIVTSDGSTYPICERAGGVLHDISTNETHISVATPSWSEELYGSDHLNQHGFLDKETSDSQGLDWETTVDGSPVTLDDDCLVPLRIT